MTNLLEGAGNLFELLALKFSNVLWSPGSTFSVASLLSAFFIATTFLLLRGRKGKRDVSLRAMLRALFPRHYWRSKSLRTDAGLLFFNVALFSVLFGWALISAGFITQDITGGLTRLAGAMPSLGLNPVLAKAIATVTLFLAYELGYWTDHALSHRVPFLWEFHKVHHTAEVLSPMTNYRTHPVDSIVFFNIEAVFLGVTGGVLNYVLGDGVGIFSIGGANVILLSFVFMTVHLQHSHIWIPATGALGRVILSPAHHQLHHSTNSAHFNKNFGSCLALWDWMFGTLNMPSRKRERLSFGIEPKSSQHHTALGTLVYPFLHSAKAAVRLIPALSPPSPSPRASASGEDLLTRYVNQPR